MAKMVKTKPKSIPNKHLHARVSYLHQAAAYLSHARQIALEKSTLKDGDDEKQDTHAKTHMTGTEESTIPAISTPSMLQDPASMPALAQRHLVSQLRGVSHKAQIRLHPDLKRSLCKRCDALLISGVTSSAILENASRGGNKPWADVHVIKCLTCGTKKRFPVGATRQKSKVERHAIKAELALTKPSEGGLENPQVSTVTEEKP